jgi:hypothetical protein
MLNAKETQKTRYFPDIEQMHPIIKVVTTPFGTAINAEIKELASHACGPIKRIMILGRKKDPVMTSRRVYRDGLRLSLKSPNGISRECSKTPKTIPTILDT